MFAYVAKNPIDISDSKWIDMTLMTSFTGKMYVVFEDVNGNQIIFDGRSSSFYSVGSDQIYKWVNETFPLSFPSYTTSNKFDSTRVHSIQIGFVDLPKDTASILDVRAVTLDKGVDAPLRGIHFEKQFGMLQFYKIDSSLERAYASVNPIMVSDTFEVINEIASGPSASDQSVFISNPIGTRIPIGANLPAFAPKITFEKVSPVKWTVHVIDSTGPFFLVLNDAYNSQWKAYYDSVNWVSGFLSSPIPERNHFVANAYANSWYIDRTGTYTITLYFWPQNLFLAGAIVSSFSIVFSLMAVFRRRLESWVSRIVSLRRVQGATSFVNLIQEDPPGFRFD
jgi:hypothetical protein